MTQERVDIISKIVLVDVETAEKYFSLAPEDA